MAHKSNTKTPVSTGWSKKMVDKSGIAESRWPGAFRSYKTCCAQYRQRITTCIERPPVFTPSRCFEKQCLYAVHTFHRTIECTDILYRNSKGPRSFIMVWNSDQYLRCIWKTPRKAPWPWDCAGRKIWRFVWSRSTVRSWCSERSKFM